MNRLNKNTSRWLIILLIAPFFISCLKVEKTYRTAKSIETEKHVNKQAIDKSYSWIERHPASFIDGGFVEISEELITFYILSNHTEDISQKKCYFKQIQKRVDLIATKKDFKVQPGEYTMLLAVAAITEKLKITSMDFRKVIEEQLISDPFFYHQHITSTIWNTVYLERLGYNPTKGLEELLPQGILSQEVQKRLLFQLVNSPLNPTYINPMTLTIYYMTHEIFSLTDFGEIPPPPVIANNQEFFSQLLDKAIEWAITRQHIDILAELIMCVKMLNFKDVPSVQGGIEFIISNQEDNGTFGITNPSRSNIYRHGILMSMMALSMA
jgi:hypothetical protein